MSRSYVACDGCSFGAWIGEREGQIDAWCEACQQPSVLSAPTPDARCPGCGERLTTGTPGFEELFGELQNLVAVLEAWLDRPQRLQPLVPERPRFLTDLNPPPGRADDPADLRHALDALAAGGFGAARTALERLASAEAAADPGLRLRVALGLGIACQRLGDLAAAERAFDHALSLDPGHVPARLDRGALRARRGDFGGAREDFDRAGDSYEARWNRAACTLIEAVATTPGLPTRERIEVARAEARAPSEFWSDPTVGRLLFTCVIERARARAVGGEAACVDARVVRAAEAEVESDSFTDRAMVLLGYQSLGLRAEAAEVARPLAQRVIERLGAEPFARGPAGRELSDSLRRTATAIAAGNGAAALAEIAAFAERSDLRHYRIPCLRCGRGSIGVEQVAETDVEAVSE